ncbi:T9SS type A sorting domain-containing protein [Bacteroidota bacterium]
MKKNLFLIVLLLGISYSAHATHFMGGEITWECLSNGKFRFILKYYRECYTSNGGSAAIFGSSDTLYSNSPLGNIYLSRISWLDISPVCNPNPVFIHIICPVSGPGMPNGAANMGAMQEYVYTSDQNYPSGLILNAIPPPGGWMFYDFDCCRNPSTNIPNSNGLSWFLTATMYSYNNMNTYPCFDSSPQFAEPAPNILCTSYPHTFHQYAFDVDFDSLVYSWGIPLKGYNQPILSYAAGYSCTSPLPGPAQNSNNVAATIDSINGDLSFESYTQGAFIIKIKVEAYKGAVKVAEINREKELVLSACVENNQPVITPQLPNVNVSAITVVDTVYANQSVQIIIPCLDFDSLPNGGPQSITLDAWGIEFGANFTDSITGCIQPPCATLYPAPPNSATYISQLTFKWQPTCDHFLFSPAGKRRNTYEFYFKCKDDLCPISGSTSKRLRIVVLGGMLDPPEIRCIEVDSEGCVKIVWGSVIDSNDFFNGFLIYRGDATAPVLLDTITDIYQTFFVDSGANANIYPLSYFFKSRNYCSDSIFSNPSMIARTIFLDAVDIGGNIRYLSWNAPLDTMVSVLNYPFKIYRKYSGGNWNLIDSTYQTHYNDSNQMSGQIIYYRIELMDTSGCSSVSNIDSLPNSIIDAGISEIIYPAKDQQKVHPHIKIHNYGLAPIDTIKINYTINGQNLVDETWNGVLLPGDSIDYYFIYSYTPPIVPYYFCVKLVVTGDAYPFNDTICKFAQPDFIEDGKEINFSLGDCIPNPGKDIIRIPYTIPEPGSVTLTIYNVNTRVLFEKVYYSCSRGKDVIELDISDLGNGVYFYRMDYMNGSIMKKMVILK